MKDKTQLLHATDGDEIPSNTSGNPTFASILEKRVSRRDVMRGGIAAAMAGVFASAGAGALAAPGFLPPRAQGRPPFGLKGELGFTPVPVSIADTTVVPAGYTARPFLPWGTPICGDYPSYVDGGLNTGADQECQIGMNHDGIHFFPLGSGDEANLHGLICMNHEYIDQPKLHPNGATIVGGARVIEDEVRKEVAAHGVSVVQVREVAHGEWEVVKGEYNRRITAGTPMEISGPVRGSDLVKTRYSPDGTMTRGTLNNCAHGFTPWGTYLTCEENWAGYFAYRSGERPRELARYGVPTGNTRYRWDTVTHIDAYARFDASVKGLSATEDYRNEPNGQGWIVEIDPFDPESTPVKRTALGRFAHEGVVFAPAQNGQPLTFYSGDDARNEYIYKFVTEGRYQPSRTRGDILDRGTLFVAVFHDDGTGEWRALDIRDKAFRDAAAAAGVDFRDQADVLVNTRLAADVVGATKMDRPEWGAVHPQTNEVYFALTNNSTRGGASNPVDAANPRANSDFGHIIRWREQGNRPWALRFEWDIFVLGGPTDDSRKLDGEPLDETNMFASPDGLWIDHNGVLWIQTDMGGSQQRAEQGRFGNNQMLAANPYTGEIRRFFVGPLGQEVTGCISTPDNRTLFINIQHPGESGEIFPQVASNWPDGGNARARSATVIITRDDGGVVGT
ncbi:PhoX family protein [Thioalkalivibrio thiocyanodenitrificans]|uniref:PhoX family protein n=1 Tax=Thioalkalivibrio thiocyanodenitrificans TaxID=243063 RepID=UPI00037906DD|nr:PhoX family phosphatase [Thioalkalivibrio thiocyanodenitrificans]